MPMYVEKGRALLFHLAAMVDVNECALEWLPDAERAAYYKKLFKAMALDKAQLDFASTGKAAEDDEITTNEQLFSRVHAQLLESAGDIRGDVDKALEWWSNAESNPRAHKAAIFFTESARAFLAMQASSASAERLLSAAGRVEDAMRHNQSAAVLEMTLVIRAFVKRELGLDGQKLVYSDVGSAYGKLIKIMAAKIASIRARDQS